MIGILNLIGLLCQYLENVGSLFYVGATDKLPPPLSREEEEYYLVMSTDGDIGLMKGIKTFSMDKNIKLATYASRCIDNEILMFLRKNKKIKTEISFDESLSFDADGNELHLEDVLGTDANIVTKPLEDELNRTMMLEEINKLPKRDKEIIVMRYGLNGKKEKTQKEVAEILGISQSYISRIEKKVIKKLKNIVKC